MSIIVNGTTIPFTSGSIKVGGTNITKVNVVKNGTITTVWELPSAPPITYLIKNGISQYTPEVSTHRGSTEMSDMLTYNVYNNGARVEFSNGHVSRDIDIYVKFPVKTDSYLNRYLFLLCSFYCEDINEHSGLSSATLSLACFDSNNNIIKKQQIAGIDAGGNPDIPESWEGTGGNSHLQIPSSGSYYMGYIIRANGSYGNKFVLDINQLYIE